jgi:hypothetical protein
LRRDPSPSLTNDVICVGVRVCVCVCVCPVCVRACECLCVYARQVMATSVVSRDPWKHRRRRRRPSSNGALLIRHSFLADHPQHCLLPATNTVTSPCPGSFMNSCNRLIRVWCLLHVPSKSGPPWRRSFSATMYVCVYVCGCIRIYIHTYIQTYIRIHIHTYTYMYI